MMRRSMVLARPAVSTFLREPSGRRTFTETLAECDANGTDMASSLTSDFALLQSKMVKYRVVRLSDELRRIKRWRWTARGSSMPLRRLTKRHKITNVQMLMMPRREPYKPTMKDRRSIENRAKLEDFERKNAEGLMFVPEKALPPWKKSLALNAKVTGSRLNFRGFRVRVADGQDEPGFPTPFR